MFSNYIQDIYRNNKGNLKRAKVIWFTGVPCSGKTTLSLLLEKVLKSWGFQVQVLDGDILRSTLCKDLSFSKEDRIENVRRIGYLSQMFTRLGIWVLVAAVSPYSSSREQVRR